MSLIRINRDPSRRQLRQFAVAWLVFFLLLALVLAWRQADPLLWRCLIAIAVLVPAIGVWHRGFLRLVYLGMSYASWPLGMVVSHIVLALIYYGILTPTGLLLRLIKPGFFPKKPDPRLPSYWQDGHGERSVKDYFKPY